MSAGAGAGAIKKQTGSDKGMRRVTDLPHSCRRVDIPLNTRQDGTVVSQKNTGLISTAAVQVPWLSTGITDNPHGIVRRLSICRPTVCHSYCGGRPSSIWNVDTGGRIVAVVGWWTALGKGREGYRFP